MDKQKREKGAKKENVHAGHRQRLKNKYLSSGADVLEPHELLELLLFYAVPRANPNPIAHALIKRFGSLKNVLTAPVEELTKVEGVGESSALLISLFPRVYCRALSDSMEEEAGYLPAAGCVFCHPAVPGEKRGYVPALPGRQGTAA